MYSKDYQETLNAYKKMHLEGTSNDDAENTFNGKSLRFFFKSPNFFSTFVLFLKRSPKSKFSIKS